MTSFSDPAIADELTDAYAAIVASVLRPWAARGADEASLRDLGSRIVAAMEALFVKVASPAYRIMNAEQRAKLTVELADFVLALRQRVDVELAALSGVGKTRQ